MSDVVALEVSGLQKHFGGLLAVCDVSLQVRHGSLTALIGPNGAGKTTVFNLITNLFTPSAGGVHLYGTSLRGKTPGDIAKLGLIRTFQSARVFPGMTVLENVMSGRHRLFGHSTTAQLLRLPSARAAERKLREEAHAFLELVGLDRYRDTHAADLPMGAQKLLEVVRALMAKPRVLLLDEPAAGLNDSETAKFAALLRAVSAAGVTLLLVEHNMQLVMGVADHIVVLESGSVIAKGAPSQIQSDPRVIAAYLGEDKESA